jgi:stage II sporulation protein AB (anti-sigma F factor)
MIETLNNAASAMFGSADNFAENGEKCANYADFANSGELENCEDFANSGELENSEDFANREDFVNLGELLNTARLDFAACPMNVSLARSLVASMIAGGISGGWDITVSMLDEIKVAVSEAVSNAIIHGYGNNATKTVRMQVWQYRTALVVQVRDEGVGIEDVPRAMQPDFTTGVEHLGLGFAFMSSFMDKLRVESAPGEGTTVTMLKTLSADGSDCGSDSSDGSAGGAEIE